MDSVSETLPKALAGDFPGRFRKIVSDPLNLLIRRDRRAGLVEDDMVYLHTGAKVAVSGPMAHYSEFSKILVVNRGVHEPLEEFVFQQVLELLADSPTMLELGAYWGHYSMWLKIARPNSRVCLVESDEENLEIGRKNLERHGMSATFVREFVGRGHFGVDRYFAENGIENLTILHCDIQGYEMEMMDDAAGSLGAGKVDYLFIVTHSQELHSAVMTRLKEFGYRIEVEADFDTHTTSFDGLVFAVGPGVRPVFKSFFPLGRGEIAAAKPEDIVSYLHRVRNSLA